LRPNLDKGKRIILKPSVPKLTQRFEDALVYAARIHSQQVRKGSGVPYISHLLGVTDLVLQDGGDEDEAIAALLHDAVEDQGGRNTLADIRSRFGERVAAIVEGCTDAYRIPKPPWRKRKESYINHLQEAPQDVLRVSLADKLHNARSILWDLHREGPPVWARFKGGKQGTLWYYQTLVEVFKGKSQSDMVGELARVVEDIIRLAQIDHSE
jgi:(p)ppGpp synthase/HD superfamily hydrolase